MAEDIKITIDIDEKGANGSLNKLSSGMKKFQGTATDSISKVTNSWDIFKGSLAADLVARAFSAVVSAMGDAVQEYLDFSEAVAEVNSILPENQKLTKQITDQFIRFSSTFGGTAQDQAKAFYQIVSAGISDTAEATSVLAASNKAAVAGLTSMETAADALTSVMASYARAGETATSASDQLFVAVREGKTTFGELGANIGKVAPLASAAGVSFSEVSGSLAFLTKTGISTDEAATGLRATIASLIKPTTDQIKAAKKMGLEFDANALATKGLAGVLADVVAKTNGSTEAITKLFPNILAGSTVMAIAKGDFGDFNRILGETANASGATDKAFGVVSESIGFKTKQMSQAFSNLGLSIIKNFEPQFRFVIKTLSSVAEGLGWLVERFQLFSNGLVNLVVTPLTFFLEGMAKVASFMNKDLGESLSKTAEHFVNIRQAMAEATEEERNRLDLLDEANEKEAEISNQRIARTDAEAQAELNAEGKKLTGSNVLAKQRKAELLKQQQIELATRNAFAVAKEQFETDKASKEKAIRAVASTSEFQELQSSLSEKEAAIIAFRVRELEAQGKHNEALQLINDSFIRASSESDIQAQKIRSANQIKHQREFEQSFSGHFLSLAGYKKNFDTGALKQEKQTSSQKLAITQSSLSQISSLTSSSNQALFRIGQSAALANAVISTAEGVAKALSWGFPLGPIFAGLIGTAGAVQIGVIASQSPPKAFASGGIVPGSNTVGDNIVARVNSGEMILNKTQQSTLFSLANSQGGGGSGITNAINNLVSAIQSQAVVVQLDGYEIARSVRNSQQSGFIFEGA